MRGARRVTPGNCRQTLYVRTEKLGECRGLDLAQLRELGGHVGNRAVVLT